MRAVVFSAFKTFPTIEEVDVPEPGPGEVLLKVAGAGACHSDVAIFDEFEADPNNGLMSPPFVLGHETAGWIEAVGPGVRGLDVGDAYLVYGPIGCGHCRACSRGQDTYCENTAEVGYLATGIGRNGGMAEYMTVPVRNLVALGDADPVAAAPLADAGLTPYHAVKRALPQLAGGGKHALVVGLGGLGLVAVQILRAITGAQVIATDLKPEAMARARDFGAVTVEGGAGQADRIRELTGGRGVDAAFDFVGAAPTIALAQAAIAQRGAIHVLGIAGGTAQWSFFTNPYEATLTNSYWGTIEDLHEVAALYRDGLVTPDVERFSMDDALEAYRRLRDGELDARAVVVPHG
ncbi:MAG TPA: NAD(P)-dependent alcohol dehydrogenase [Acidimicrobiales bacterium]|jgi:propanol-preferring alcohol dehydrogenase|nr:NAD(P)-dependent alcohol dehydrogenase [Acidimicrobiales bacterium]